MDTDTRRAWSPREAADQLGVNHLTVRAAIERGELRAVRLGRRVLIPDAELRRLLGEPDASSAKEQEQRHEF